MGALSSAKGRYILQLISFCFYHHISCIFHRLLDSIIWSYARGATYLVSVIMFNQIHKVPATDMEALKSPLMGLFEKRRARNFFIYVQNYDEVDPKTHQGLDLTTLTTKELIVWVHWWLLHSVHCFVSNVTRKQIATLQVADNYSGVRVAHNAWEPCFQMWMTFSGKSSMNAKSWFSCMYTVSF